MGVLSYVKELPTSNRHFRCRGHSSGRLRHYWVHRFGMGDEPMLVVTIDVTGPVGYGMCLNRRGIGYLLRMKVLEGEAACTMKAHSTVSNNKDVCSYHPERLP